MDEAHARLIERINHLHPWMLERFPGGGERDRRLSLVHYLLKEDDEKEFRWEAHAGVDRLAARMWGISREVAGELLTLDVVADSAQGAKDASRYYLATGDRLTAHLIATRMTKSPPTATTDERRAG